MKSDYRNTEYCPELNDITLRKADLKSKIREEHPRIKIMYNQVKETEGNYKTIFMRIYNDKCCYCGNSINNIGAVLFEVDHFICASSFTNNEEAGKIENLVLACHDCNRSKSNYLIEDHYITILNPDLEGIKQVFIRDEKYYIQISDKFKDDHTIKEFYAKLKLGYQTRRLDYLLMNMRGLCEKLNHYPSMAKLNVALRKLHEKRNMLTCNF